MSIFAAVCALSVAIQSGAFQTRIPGLASAPANDAVLVTVGSVAIKSSDVLPLLWEARGNEILNEFVAHQMVRAAGEAAGILVTDADVNKEMEDQLKEFGATLPPGSNPREALLQQGITNSRFFLNVKTDLYLARMASQRFKAVNYVKVSTILIAPSTSNVSDVSAAIKKIEAAYDKLVKGESWEKVLGETVEDPNAKRNGGLLGWRSLELFPAATRTELINLKAGQYTKPVQTAFGVQIFRLEKEGSTATPQEVIEMRSELLPGIKDQILAEIRKNTKIERIWPPKPAGS